MNGTKANGIRDVLCNLCCLSTLDFVKAIAQTSIFGSASPVCKRALLQMATFHSRISSHSLLSYTADCLRLP